MGLGDWGYIIGSLSHRSGTHSSSSYLGIELTEILLNCKCSSESRVLGNTSGNTKGRESRKTLECLASVSPSTRAVRNRVQQESPSGGHAGDHDHGVRGTDRGQFVYSLLSLLSSHSFTVYATENLYLHDNPPSNLPGCQRMNFEQCSGSVRRLIVEYCEV